MKQTFEIEIRRYVGSKYRVVSVERFNDFIAARRRIREYNEVERPNNRTAAEGPWPIV